MFVLEECTVESIRTAFESGELTSYDLVLSYMERIALYDKSGVAINSVLELNPDALFIAEAMDRERKAGKIRSPLHGVPIMLKDNINTHDKMCTSAGSLALIDNYTPYDATVTKKIREAGLVIMGKTNMTELANFMSFTMQSGYSSRGGQVINPYKPGAAVWGSSTGSAVAVSSNFCALAIGTETNGSILAPSYINGSVGIKPTRGLVSRHGIVPICIAQDTAGPMTRTVADAAALLNVIVGEDENDPSTWCRQDVIPKDYTVFLKLDGLKNVKVGINRGYYDDKAYHEVLDEEMIALTEKACKIIKKCGATLVQDTNIPHLKNNLNVMLYEFKKCLNAYLATNPALKIRSLKDLIDFYGDHPKEGLKYGMTILQAAEYETSGTLTDPEYISARIECLRSSQKNGIDRIMDKYDIDILLCPAITNLAPISGYPSISVPAGYKKDNTPFGITFVGRAFSEPILIAAAYAYEQESHERHAPVFTKKRGKGGRRRT
jgi:amidase